MSHNIGVQDGLIDPKHEEAMGTAVFLFLWCIKCQTPQNGGVFVFGGAPLTYQLISSKTGFPERKIRMWLDRLRKSNYVKVTYLNYKMMRIEIMKAKKWAPKQAELPYAKPSTKDSQSQRKEKSHKAGGTHGSKAQQRSQRTAAAIASTRGIGLSRTVPFDPARALPGGRK